MPRLEREELILTVAVDEFAERGYAGASMAATAARAGVSKPLVYQYFGSKDALYLACLTRLAGALLERLETAHRVEDDSVLSRVDTLRVLFESLQPQRNAWRMLYDTSAPVTGQIAAVVSGYRKRTAELAASGSAQFLRARGNRSSLDASALSAVWMGLVDSLVTWWLGHPTETAAQMTDRCHRLITAVLA